MHWAGWIVIVLATIEGGWLIFDGSRALIVGDYVTPSSGPHAGQLGPWSRLVSAFGIEPRSTPAKILHGVTGIVILSGAVCLLIGFNWAVTAMILAAACGLWYLPLGTVLSLIQIVILLLVPLRDQL